MPLNYNSVMKLLKQCSKLMKCRVIDIENNPLEILFQKKNKEINSIAIKVFVGASGVSLENEDIDILKDNLYVPDVIDWFNDNFVKGRYEAAIGSLDHSAQYPCFALCSMAHYSVHHDALYKRMAEGIIEMHNDICGEDHYMNKTKIIPKNKNKVVANALKRQIPINKTMAGVSKKYAKKLFDMIDGD
jgi:hypothetical protein